MKKKLNILVLASAFAMLGVTACGNQQTSSDTTPSSTDVCVVTDDIRGLAEKAFAGVNTTYSSWSSSGVTGNQTLTTTAKKTNDAGTQTYDFTITYSVDSKYSANLSVSEDGKALNVTCPNSLKGGTDVQTKIHAKVFVKGCSDVAYETDVNVLVKAVAQMSLEYIYSTDAKGEKVVANGSSVAFNAIYMGMYPQQGAIFGDGEYAMLAYKTTSLDESIKVGDAVAVTGTLSDYSGLRELSSSGTTVTKLSTRPADLVDPVAIKFDSATARALKWGDDNRAATVTGAKVTKVSTSDSGNLTVTVSLNGNSYAVFMNATYSADVIDSWKHTKAGATEATVVEAGDIVSFTGYVSAYNNVYQFVYGNCTAWEEAPISVTAPSQLLVNETGKITTTLRGGVTPTTVTYSSSDSEVVSVSEDGTVTGLKTGTATITVTATGTVDGAEVTKTDTVTITVAEITPVTKTIAELNALVAAETDTSSYTWFQDDIYQVTGIFEGYTGDKYGNGYLTDATTGETIKIYGLSGTANNGFTYNGGKWSYSNPKDANKTLTDVKNGEEVTLNVMLENAKGIANIAGSVISHAASTNTYVSTITVGDNGTATLSSTDAKAYGETITVTATPAEGYVVDTVKVKTAYGTTTLDAAEDGTYSYTVTCKNEVTVTFKAKPVAGSEQTVTLGVSDFTVVSSAAAIDQTVKGFRFEISNGVINSSEIKLYQNKTITVSTTLGTMTKIAITTTSGNPATGFGTANENLTISDDELTATWASATGTNTVTLTADAKQVRITAIEITYKLA